MRAFAWSAALVSVVCAGCSLDTDGQGNLSSAHGGSAGQDAGPDGAAGSGGTGGIIDPDSGTDTGSDQDAPDAAAPACGDGKIDPGEICDDGNGASGDGCTANCDAIEKDFACPDPGEPCVSTVVCGDGKVNGSETCDDQNSVPGDGCDADCHTELGWDCPVPGVACQAAACGDGIVAGAEECEDDDAIPEPLDGCDELCQLEDGWVCNDAGAACTPTTCGDGVTEGSEQCDDANNDMGDGCTPFCVKEPDCSAGACTSSCGDGLSLPTDNEECEDGNTKAGDGCSPSCTIEPGWACEPSTTAATELHLPTVLRDFQASHPDFEGTVAVDLGIVAADLGSNGKPVYAHPGGSTPTTSGEAAFAQWYTDVAGVNDTILQTMTLAQLASGVFRFDDGDYFPLDGQGFGNEGNNHNFHFTSEVRYWFEYKGGEQLEFTGDDDVWVFVNRKLAVDLGGVHGAMSGSVTLDAATGAQLGLEVGKIYETVVFQAERHTTQSNYRLTLSDFVNSRTDCHTVCGDGIKTPDEACDDGENDGGYGECAPGCTLGPYCGDGEEQTAEGEECDDGVNLTPYTSTPGAGCGPGCVNPGYCGDGQVDSTFGEACDDGVNAGGYGACEPGCALGPYCGDGQIQTPDETCDDGNRVSGDGCGANCESEGPH